MVADRHRAGTADGVGQGVDAARAMTAGSTGPRDGRASERQSASRAGVRRAPARPRAARARRGGRRPRPRSCRRRCASTGLALAVADRHHGHAEAQPGGLGDALREVADLAHLAGQADLAERDDALRAERPRWRRTRARSRSARSLAGSASRAPPTVETKTSWAYSAMPQCCWRTARIIATRDGVEPGRRTSGALERALGRPAPGPRPASAAAPPSPPRRRCRARGTGGSPRRGRSGR